MALLHSSFRTTMIFQLVLASYLLDTVYSAGVGEACPSGTNCDPGLVCDTDTKCKLDVGGDCSALNSRNCKTGTTCDPSGLCKLDVGGDCSAPNSGNCKTGTTCDHTQHCTVTSPTQNTAASSNPTTPGAGGTTSLAPYLGLVNHPCSKNDTIAGGCVKNAWCKSSTCVCIEGYHAKNNGNCGIVATPATATTATPPKPCTRDDECVDNAICWTNTTCRCDIYHIDGINGNCVSRVLAGSLCHKEVNDTQGNCTVNAVCNDQNPNACECKPQFYKNDTFYCVDRIKLGQPCVYSAEEENNCIIGAECYPNNTCQCNGYSYTLSNGTCVPIVQVGKDCTTNKVCEENAHCNTANLCMCNDDFFYNEIEKHCKPRKPLGAVCSHVEECVQNANCSLGTCQCNDNYYNQQQRCNPRLPQYHQCDSSVQNQCLVHGECVNGICQCDRNSYNTGSDCKPTLHFDSECDFEVSDPRQCESNTTCGFHQGEGNTRCGCDVNHFFNGEYCVKRAAAGDSCPYASNSSLGLNIPEKEFERQCVQNAECNLPLEVCECSPGFYDRNGRCPKQIAPDSACDPWTNFLHQCAGNYQCLYGRCVPQHF